MPYLTRLAGMLMVGVGGVIIGRDLDGWYWPLLSLGCFILGGQLLLPAKP
jgi:hypothetical protein